MSRPSQLHASSALVLPLCLLLSACGGNAASVASIPPPPVTPTPTPTSNIQVAWLDSPATRNGTYDVIGRLNMTSGDGRSVTSRFTAPGEFTMDTDWYFGRASGDLPWYTLNGPGGILPAGKTAISVNGPFLSWSFDPTRSYEGEPRGSYCCQMLGQRLTSGTFSYDFTRGVTTWQPGASTWLPSDNHTGIEISLDYDIGYSYVAMGDWEWKEVATGNSGELLFVEGKRTPPSGIPASGTATYDARGLTWVKDHFTLTADFGQRTIAALINQDYRSQPNAYPLAFGIHVSGSAPFSSDGLFNIALSGTTNFTSNYTLNTPPPTETVSGAMNGAFFGPNAEQVGGTFVLNRSNGTQMLQDAFVGQQQKP